MSDKKKITIYISVKVLKALKEKAFKLDKKISPMIEDAIKELLRNT